jgi:radical SAM superfamily enzyme YgiQ (UPF0313 family)
MSSEKVLMLNPNPRSMSLVQPVVALFYSIFKNNNIEMKFFDTTLYDLTDDFTDPTKVAKESLVFKGSDSGEDKIPNGNVAIPGDFLIGDLRSIIESFQPDVIMVSSTESTVDLTRFILSSIRDFDIPHVLGGVFATYAPDLAISYPEVDILCIGESEPVIVPLVKELAKGVTNFNKIKNLPGVWTKSKFGIITKNPVGSLTDMDLLPRFDASIYDPTRFYRTMNGKMYKMFPVETHRGCPLKCTFCNSPVQNNMYKEATGERYFRGKKISKVMDDVRYFIDELGAEYLFLWADNLLAWSKKETDEFCEAYSDYKIPFYAQSYPTTLNEYKINKLANVGLDRLGMGLEHGNEEFRTNVVNRKYSNEKAIQQVKILNDYNVEFSLNNIVGFPGETPELHMDTVELNRALNPKDASCAIFTPFHGTPLRKIAIDLGYLKDTDQLAPTNFDRSILDMKKFTADEIAGKARVFNLYLKFPKERWHEIKKAESLTDEGDYAWEKLKEEYKVSYQ